MRILAIDTALAACAACIAEDASDDLLAQESLAMERGHAEALLPLLERVVARVEGGFESLDRVAVTVGPGSYTGLRVGLSAARAIGLALGVPVVGVTTLSALLAPLLAEDDERLLVAAIDARHGQIYLQAIGGSGGLVVPPCLVTVEEAVARLRGQPFVAAGSGAPALAAAADAGGGTAGVRDPTSALQISTVASLGLVADPEQALPRPLYLRGPDATPQDHARLPRR